MENSYKSYKIKYQFLKFSQSGGKLGLQQWVELFNQYFDDNWVFTGSYAIKLYLEYINSDLSKNINPNDVDIIVVQKGLIYNKQIGDFIRRQDTPERSITFENGEESFDVTVKRNVSYIDLQSNTYKIIDIDALIDTYKYCDRDKDEDIAADVRKIELLDTIKPHFADIKVKNINIRPDTLYGKVSRLEF